MTFRFESPMYKVLCTNQKALIRLRGKDALLYRAVVEHRRLFYPTAQKIATLLESFGLFQHRDFRIIKVS